MYENNLMKADINIATSGNNTVISAPTSGYIAIDHINFVPASAVDVQLKTGTTNYGGAYSLADKQAFTIENAINNDKGIITCGSGEAFVINLSGAVQVSGFIRYRIVV